MKFQQIKTGTILETENKEAMALMQKSDAYQVLPEASVKPDPPQEPPEEPDPPQEPKAAKKK